MVATELDFGDRPDGSVMLDEGHFEPLITEESLAKYRAAKGESEDYGSSKSGNYGHKGVPGQRGGSAPRGGIALDGGGVQKTKEEIEEDAWQAERKDKIDAMLEGGYYHDGPVEEAEKILVEFEGRAYDKDYESAKGTAFGSGEVILEKSGGKDYVDISPAEKKNLRGGVLTHNHPKGGSFSPEDVMLAHDVNLSQLRVVGEVDGQRVRYKMTPEPLWTMQVSEQELYNSYLDAAYEVRINQLGDVSRGTMTESKAQSLHHHKVWQLVEKRVYEEKGVMLNYQKDTW